MTSKTVKYTLFQNAESPTIWSGSDNDVTVVNNGNTHIVISDLDHSTAKDGDLVRQGVFDLDLSQDITLNANFVVVVPGGDSITSTFKAIISLQSGNNYNVTGTFIDNTDSTEIENSIQNNSFDDWMNFKINGVTKQTLSSLSTGTQSLGTHSHIWNGTDTITVEFEMSQRNTSDSTYQTGFSAKFEIT